MSKSKYVLVGLIWLCHYAVGYAQESPTTLLPEERAVPLPHLLPPTLDLATTPEEAPTAPPLATEAPATAPVPEGESPAEASEETVQSVIYYSADDHIKLNIKDQTIRLYGAGVIDYDNIRLEADEVFLDWVRHTFAVFSKKDAEGRLEQKAVLTKDGVEYIAESARYNFESHRAVAKKLFTKQDDGILRANRAKKDRKDTYYADEARYTTCNLARPHFHITAYKLKLVQDKQVMSGPFLLHFDKVPTPLGFFFGFYHFPKDSGFIFPTYTIEDSLTIGFALKEGGYYIRFNDYVDLALRGDVYSKGNTSFRATSHYKKRYQYGGHLDFQRNTHLKDLREIALPHKESTWRFRWNHHTENNRTSSLAAEVDLQSLTYKEQNMSAGDEGLQASMHSNIRYTNELVGFPYKLSASVSYAKNFQSKEAHATLPALSLRTGNIYPLRKKSGSSGRWYTDTHFQHTVEFQHKLSNRIGNERLDFSPDNWSVLWKHGKYGVQHTLPLKTHIKLLRYFNLTPGLQCRARWYGESVSYQYDEATGQVAEKKVYGFAQAFDYNYGASLTTTLYGTHFFGRRAAIQALRHQIEPVARFTYTPDCSAPVFGHYQTLPNGQKYYRFKDGIYAAPEQRATAVMHLELNNRLEMKVKQGAKATERTQKVPILEGFDWSTSYDFLAEAFKLRDIEMKARTRLFNDLINIHMNTTFDPYIYKRDPSGAWQRMDELAWHHGQGLGRVKAASLSIGTQLRSSAKAETPEEEFFEDFEEYPGAQAELQRIQANPEQYVDFNVPWTLRLGYEWRYSSPMPGKKSHTQALTFGGDLSLTEKWKLTYNSGYDLTKKELIGSTTQIGVHRDLHCWEMNFNWCPLGKYQRYEFAVGVRSPMLQYLKYNRKSSHTQL